MREEQKLLSVSLRSHEETTRIGGMETTKTESVSGIPKPANFEDLAPDRILATRPDFAQPDSTQPDSTQPDFGQDQHAGAERQTWSSDQKPVSPEPTGRFESGPSVSTASWNPVGQSPAVPAAPSISGVPSMTPWTAAAPVPPAAIQWPGDTHQRASRQDSYPSNPTGQTAQTVSTPSNGTSSGSGGSGGPNNSGGSNAVSMKKPGWIKPALIGGLVGALTSGAILGGVLANTRSTNNESKQAAQPSVKSEGSAAAVPQAGGTKLVPALASSSGQADVPRIVSELSKSIVTINTKGFPSADFFGSSQVPEGAGTGIVLTKDGFVLTNAHVIADAQTIKVTVPGGKTCQADVVGRDRANDVAVVKCRNIADFVPAALGKSGEMKVGESVVAIGNALGLEGNPTVTTGILSATNRTLEGDGERLTGLLQTDAAINPGNSGGPLVNARGQVVGMNTAIYQNTNNIGFAIPIDAVLPIIEKIRSGEIDKPKTFLGVTTQTMDATIQRQYSLGTDKGAIVVDVTVGSPAQNAGLQRGDIITKFDGVSITDNRLLGEQVRKHKAGDEVDMTYLRGSQSISTKVTLGSARTAG